MSYPSRLISLVLAASLLGCAAAPSVPTPEPVNLASALESVAKSENAFVSINQPAACCKKSLPQCLGITGLFQGIGRLVDRIRNRLGMRFPGLEAKPELLAISDPANMSEDSPPAVKAAAEIKAEEDAAAQKIKALRYLASIGCGGCYPDVEDALMAALDDCTEEVRYEAVLAIRDTTGTNCCYCAQGACCSEKIQNKLHKLAYDKDGACCEGEPSARVRRQARMALAQCGPPRKTEEPEPVEAPAPTEGPSEAPKDGPEELPEDKTTGASTNSPTLAQGASGLATHLAAFTSPSGMQGRNAIPSSASQPRALPPVFAR